MHTTALVLFSGGQDSTTCLAYALSKYERVETVAFDYGQRHHIELDARLNVLRELRARFPAWAAKLGQDHLLDLAVLGEVSETSLTRDTAIAMEASGLPNTFVPGRNLMFLTLAAALAYRRGLQVIGNLRMQLGRSRWRKVRVPRAANHRVTPIGAITPPPTRKRSAGESSIERPRCPAETTIVACTLALESSSSGTGRFEPSGLTPPGT